MPLGIVTLKEDFNPSYFEKDGSALLAPLSKIIPKDGINRPALLSTYWPSPMGIPYRLNAPEGTFFDSDPDPYKFTAFAVRSDYVDIDAIIHGAVTRKTKDRILYQQMFERQEDTLKQLIRLRLVAFKDDISRFSETDGNLFYYHIAEYLQVNSFYSENLSFSLSYEEAVYKEKIKLGEIILKQLQGLSYQPENTWLVRFGLTQEDNE